MELPIFILRVPDLETAVVTHGEYVSPHLAYGQELTRAFGQVKVHLFIQSFTLVFIPLAMTILVKLLALLEFVDKPFLDG